MKKTFLLPLFIAAFFATTNAFGQGQIITISTEITHDAYGNGDPDSNGKATQASPIIPGVFVPAGDPNGNTLEITSTGSVPKSAVGGYTTAQEVNANNNTVIIGGTVGPTEGGVVDGGFSMAEANGNTVIINGGTVKVVETVIMEDTFYDNGIVTGGNGGTAVSNNTVTLNSGIIEGGIKGGTTSGSGGAANNTVTIKGGTVTGYIYGGETFGISTSSDNTLNLHIPLSTGEINYFQNLNFHLPSDIQANDTMLTLITEANLTDVTVDVAFDATAPSLEIGDVITLINNVTGTPQNDGAALDISGYTMEVSVSEGALIATVTDIKNVGISISEMDKNQPSPKIVGYTTILGQRLSEEPQRGLFIILYDNGTSKKVMK